MNEFLGLVVNSLTEGFLYAVLALGVYITYSILDFPDLSVDGTVPLGATVAAVLMLQGLNPWLATLAAFAVGAAAGCVTGLLHVKLKIRPLLCGILVMTALLSDNLVIMKAGTDGGSTASLFNEPTIFNTLPVSVLPKYIGGYALRALILVVVLSVASKLLLGWYFSTRSGILR